MTGVGASAHPEGSGQQEDAMTATARAVRFDHYGGPEVLYVTDIPMPVPEPGEVVVAVRAAGINPGESSIRRRSRAASRPPSPPARAATWPAW